MARSAAVKYDDKATKYAEKKYRSFYDAKTPEESLSALWHVSQLVHLISDKNIKKIIHVARRNPDFKIRFETSYLSSRWIRRFVISSGVVSVILFVMCLISIIVGIVYEISFGLVLGTSYVLGALGIEGLLVTWLLYWKQKVVSRSGEGRRRHR